LLNQNDFIIDVKSESKAEIGEPISLVVFGHNSVSETGQFSCEITIKSKCDSKALIEGDTRFSFEVCLVEFVQQAIFGPAA